jgi:iron complex outermembrane receptor protein
MMKQVKFKFPVRMLAIICGLILSVSAYAQQITVQGNVKDATGEPIIGATIRVAGETGGVVSDIDGNFTISANHGATLQISYLGYKTKEISASSNVVVTLEEDAAESLNEVVVIGYGAVKKSDLTGSVAALKPDSKNKGLIVNPQDMLAGKVAGVNIITNDGAPGSGAQIRVRGGSSLNASNDPLIVIDGLAMDNEGVKGLSNILSMISTLSVSRRESSFPSR